MIFELSSFPLFKDLQPRTLNELTEAGVQVSTGHRQILFSAGDTVTSFYIVLKGAYKLVRPTVQGDDVIVYFATPGDVLAALAITRPQYPISAVSMGPSSCLKIPKATFSRFWSGNALIQNRLNNLLYTRMNLLQEEKLRSKLKLQEKVARLILDLMDRYPVAQKNTLPIPLTRQEIADTLGATVESVIRIMSDWSHQGIIKTSDQLIEIIRTDKIIHMMNDPLDP